MGAAAAERTKLKNAKETGIWIEPGKAELADDDFCATEQVEIRHSGNHLSPMENDNFSGQDKVNPDATLGPKPKGTNLIEDDDPRPRRSSRRQQLLSTVEMSGSCPTARQAASRQFPLNFLTNFAGFVL